MEQKITTKTKLLVTFLLLVVSLIFFRVGVYFEKSNSDLEKNPARFLELLTKYQMSLNNACIKFENLNVVDYESTLQGTVSSIEGDNLAITKEMPGAAGGMIESVESLLINASTNIVEVIINKDYQYQLVQYAKKEIENRPEPIFEVKKSQSDLRSGIKISVKTVLSGDNKIAEKISILPTIK